MFSIGYDLHCISSHRPFCYPYKEHQGDQHSAALLTQVSPIAWQHINLCGRYEFTREPEAIHLPAIIQALAQAPVTQDCVL
jgi:hypothetical protein